MGRWIGGIAAETEGPFGSADIRLLLARLFLFLPTLSPSTATRSPSPQSGEEMALKQRATA
ncbi:MAG TPA: hypothetical protein DCP26_07980, partial [Brevundimonas sp.]|nr:hypothetical protein [Brevundimonas sp.]